MTPQSKIESSITGRPSLFSASSCVDPLDTNNWTLIHEGKNTICSGMYQSVTNLLMRNFDDWQPTTIVTGYGGDWDQAVTANQGSRQPPDFTDTIVRKPLFYAPIVQVLPSAPGRFYYVAIIRPADGTTDLLDPARPYINELGLLAHNGTLLAHYVTPLAAGGSIATRYSKSNVAWLIIRWELEFAGATP